MFKIAVLGTLAGVGILWAVPSQEVLASPNQILTVEPFQRIEQPLSRKLVVALGGLSLIGLELWWFVFAKPKAYKATVQNDIQDIRVTVDGGYSPSRIIVQAGQAVRLSFERKDPSLCLEEVRFPDFQIARKLPLHQVTPIEILPQQAGQYEFTCGMNMFRGILDVQD